VHGAGEAPAALSPWHDCDVPVVIVLAAAVILGGVVVVAMGRGGELSRERPDLPARSDFRTWSDVARYRPPPALLGYHAGATEHALSLIARTIAERDAEIDWLRNRLAEAIQTEPAPADQGSAEQGSSEQGSSDQGSAELASTSAGTDQDDDLGLQAGYHEVPGVSAPGYEARLADDSDPGKNAHVRPSLSVSPRPSEGE
jgi:hypothetical protein